MTLYEEVKEYLYGELGKMVYMPVEGCCLAMMATRKLIENGTVEGDINKTRKKFNDYACEYGAVYEYMKSIQKEMANPFYAPEMYDAESYHVIAMFILQKIPFLAENWFNEIELNFDNIELIGEALENDDTEYFEY